jgi:hypothetical protein
MKKLLFIIALFAGLFSASTDSFGQQITTPPVGQFRLTNFTKSDSSLSVVNTTAESDTFVLGEKQAVSNIIITATYQKINGTVTGGAKLYGSTTGSYWEPIVAAGDTAVWVSTTTSKQGYSWEFGPATPKYRRFKVVYQTYGTSRGWYGTKIEFY